MTPATADIEIHLERLVEPYSGMPLLGVGGTGPARPVDFRVEIRLDGQPASVAVPTVESPANGPPRLHFGTQLPFDPSASRVQVVAVSAAGGEVLLGDEPLAAIGHRPETPAGVAPDTTGLLGRTLSSLRTGEVFSPWRWRARIGRAGDKLRRLPQRVRDKLLARRFRPRAPHDAYVENTAVTPRLRAAMTAEAARFGHRPVISILLPVYNSNPVWLAEAIASVRDQVYDRWELCLADDASTDPKHLRFLDRLPADPRIKLVRRDKNGHICHATNAAAGIATGAFVALLDHDDRLAPHALFEIVRLLQDHRDADLIYSDEDKIDAAGRRYDPQFKPDWSPELLLSYNYVNHFCCVRRTLFEKAGRFRPGYEGSQDHDLLLRATERTDRVCHIPHILYHWRAHAGSTAGSAEQKGYVHTSGRRAVADALARRGIDATPYVPPFADRLGLPILGLDGPDAGPPVAVVVHGEAAAAARTARAVKQGTAYRNLTVYLVVDDAPPAEALNRMAAGRAEDWLLFLAAGVEPADPRWLSRLLAYAHLPGVGAVGGLLRAADGSVASAGTVLGLRDGTAPGDAFAGLPADAISYYFLAEVGRTVSAPGRGCLLTSRAVFERVGGFDADRFGRTLFAVEYAVRLAGAGLRSVHVGGAELRTRGGQEETGRGGVEEGGIYPLSPPLPVSPAGTPDPLELRAFKRAHGRRADHFYNPNLSERDSFRSLPDAPLVVPAEARSPAVRCLVAAHNLNAPEGAPRYLSEIVLGLRDRGRLDPAVVSPLGGAGEAVYTLAGVPVAVSDAAWGRRFVDGRWTPAEYAAAQADLGRLLRTHRPEVVLANTLLTFPVVEAAARAGVPAVWVIHESYSQAVLDRVFPPFARARVRRAFALAARVVPASHDTAALFAGWGTRGNVRVLHNGLDPAPFDAYLRRVSKADAAGRIPGSPGKKRVVAVGTVCERKGQHTLVEAAAVLAKTRDDFEVHLVGMRDGVPYAAHVRELVRRHGLDRVVFPVPETDDVWRFLRAADVFACTSHVETFSRAVLEAEAFGLPIVSTACCGLSEQVYWGENALGFDSGDTAGLAARLDTVLSDDRLRADMGHKSRAAFDAHLSLSESLDRYEAVILAAARTGPRARSPLPAPAAAAAPLRRAG